MQKKSSKAGILSRFQQVVPNCAEWNRIEYLLQMTFSTVILRLANMYSISDTKKYTRFETATAGKMCLDFVSYNNQNEHSPSVMTVMEKGIKGIVQLTFGQMDFKNLTKDAEDQYWVLICRGAVGNSLLFSTKNITISVPYDKKPDLMTSDFDSLFLLDDNQNSKEIRQNFLFYNSEQCVLPLYAVQFTVNDNQYKELQSTQSKTSRTICELCEDNMAVKYCQTEDIYLCMSCDLSHHNHKLAHKHTRLELSDRPKSLGFCTVHPEIRLELFCLDCTLSLCIDCKVKGDHSTGENTMHKIVRIMEKYIETAEFIREVDQNLEKKKASLINASAQIEKEIKEVNRKSSETQKQIYEIAQKAVQRLKTVTKVKMSLLMSNHLHIKRHLDQIQWIDKFIKYENEILQPNDLMVSWSRHGKLRRQFLAHNPTLADVNPLFRLEGYLAVNDGGNVAKKTPGEFERDKQGNRIDNNNANLMRSKIDPQSQGQTVVKSKNNLLNLSVLRHV